MTSRPVCPVFLCASGPSTLWTVPGAALGNAAKIVVKLPDNVRLASNDAGITGGVRL